MSNAYYKSLRDQFRIISNGKVFRVQESYMGGWMWKKKKWCMCSHELPVSEKVIIESFATYDKANAYIDECINLRIGSGRVWKVVTK